MDPTRFDRVTKRFADRRLSRRQALAQGGTGLAVGALAGAGVKLAAAQDATPQATDDAREKVMYLFVQSFQSGSIAAKEGSPDTYTLTLEAGLGQTIFFSDRPERIVGAAPTDRFLAGLGFEPDNPPNAALVVETAPGETDVAVVELHNPLYDVDTRTATYDVQVLENWQSDLELGFQQAPTDLAQLEPTFGAAQLFIDDCADTFVTCRNSGGQRQDLGQRGMCWHLGDFWCRPCQDYAAECNATHADFCQGSCGIDLSCGMTCT